METTSGLKASAPNADLKNLNFAGFPQIFTINYFHPSALQQAINYVNRGKNLKELFFFFFNPLISLFHIFID